jgi:hypothetical protein
MDLIEDKADRANGEDDDFMNGLATVTIPFVFSYLGRLGTSVEIWSHLYIDNTRSLGGHPQ